MDKTFCDTPHLFLSAYSPDGHEPDALLQFTFVVTCTASVIHNKRHEIFAVIMCISQCLSRAQSDLTISIGKSHAYLTMT